MIVGDRQQCSGCREWKSLDGFHAYKGHVRSSCKECCSKRALEAAGRDIVSAAKLIFRAHRQQSRRSLRRRALALASEVTVETIIEMWNAQGGMCAVTGIPMTHIYGRGRGVMTNASLDRKDNDKGYEVGNVRLVCKAVNLMKNSMSDSDLRNWCRAILRGAEPINISEPPEGHPRSEGEFERK